MPKLTYTAIKGAIQELGSGVRFESFPTHAVSASFSSPTASATLTRPGVYSVSGTAATTMTLPPAADVPGGLYTVRSVSGTGQGSDWGTNFAVTVAVSEPAFELISDSAVSGMTGLTSTGTQCALKAGDNNSITFLSDGHGWAVLAISGSTTISTPG